MLARKILAAVDFSASTQRVIQYATALAVDTGATLLIVHVDEEPFAYGAEVPLDCSAPGPRSCDMLEKIVPAVKSVGYEHHLLVGTPATEIVAFAEQQHADMIVIGTHGRRGWKHWLIGSVAEMVVRQAPCPVVTLKLPGREEPPRVIDDAAHDLPARLPTSATAKRQLDVSDEALAEVARSLVDLRVRDIMSRHVVEATRDQLMTDIAVEMVRHDLSAVPVVDDEGRCVGMLAASDYMKELAPEERFDEIAQRQNARALLDEFSERALTAEELSGDRVFMHMSENVRGIDPEATVADAAKLMCAAHVHRLPVLNPDHRVLGIVSSLDVVAALSVALASVPNAESLSTGSPG